MWLRSWMSANGGGVYAEIGGPNVFDTSDSSIVFVNVTAVGNAAFATDVAQGGGIMAQVPTARFAAPVCCSTVRLT